MVQTCIYVDLINLIENLLIPCALLHRMYQDIIIQKMFSKENSFIIGEKIFEHEVLYN